MVCYVIISSVKLIRISIFPVIIFLLILFYACQKSVPEPGGEPVQSGKKLRVVTTIAPLYSFTSSIAGGSAVVENLLPQGMGPHEYSFSPQDMKKIAEADVLIKNGAGLESWLDNLIASSQKDAEAGRRKLLIVDTSSGLDIIDNDPHIWLSPRNAVAQVINIRDALIRSDPANSESYMKNAAGYIARLENLDMDIREQAGTFRTKELIVFHSAFLYFTRDYGLKQAAVIRESPAKQPSPGHIANVIDIIKQSGATAIFTEPQFSDKLVSAIAEDLDLQVYSLDTLETGDLHPDWYENMMRQNLEVLKKALN